MPGAGVAARRRQRAPEERLDRLARHAARPQQRRVRAGHVDDRRLDADRAGATVEDVVDRVAEILHDVRRGGRADRAEAVGARRRDARARTPCSSASAIGCDGTRRPTVGAPPVTASSTLGSAPGDQRQRPRPESRGQRARRVRQLGGPRRQLVG
jgi:hypothetical protein